MRAKRLGVLGLILGACILAASMCTGSALAAGELIPFYTPPAGGAAYILGAGIISVNNKYLPDVKMVHEATSGTMDIVRRMIQRTSAKKECFGVFGTVDALRAYKGEGEYGGKPFSTLRQIVFVNNTDLYLVVPGNSPIKTFADVKGKRIGMGGPGSTVATTAQFILDGYGVKKEDFKPYYFTYRETVDGLQDGSLDGGFVAGGYPIAAYTELSSRSNVRIVPVSEEFIKKVTKDHPYYYGNVIKAKSYKGLENDTLVLGFTTAVFSTDLVSPDLIYKVLKNLFDHKEDYYAIHGSAKDMTVQSAVKGLSVPLHAGAEKYFKEIGAIK